MPRAKPKETQDEVETALVETQDKIEDAADAVETGDEAAFDEAIAEAQKRIDKIEGDLKWLKTEAKKSGEISQSTNSTLENLSSAMNEMKQQLSEMTEKFQNLSLPVSSVPKTEDETEVLEPSIPTETPAVQAAKAPPQSAPADVAAPGDRETRTVRKLRPI